MAGKTFHGIGDLEDEVPPLGPDDVAPEGDEVRGVYSGPTVVDDDKVAEGLERLRSLEPADDDGGVGELVADSGSEEPTIIGVPVPRPTAVGRSLSSEPPGPQQVVHQDNLRGTMFGHSIHRPELHVPVDAEDNSSGPIYVPPTPPAPQTTQMVPYRPGAQRLPGSYVRPVQPFPRAEIFAPFHEPDVLTETIPPLGRRIFWRAVAAVAGTAAVFAGVLAWMQFRGGDLEEAPMPVVAPAPAIPAPAADPAAFPRAPGSEATPSAAAAPSPAKPSPPPAKPSPSPTKPPLSPAKPSPSNDPPVTESAPPRAAPAAEAPGIEPAPTEATDAQGADSARTRRRPTRAERRRATAAEPVPTAEPATPPPSKPSPRKRPQLEEDPDATLPPSAID